MPLPEDEEELLRAVAFENSRAVLRAREKAEEALRLAKRHLEQKASELADQREWFRVALSSIGDAVITTDIEGNITFLNPVAEHMTGWSIAEALNCPVDRVFNIINEQTGNRAENPITEVLRDGTVVGLANHTALISRDGTHTSIEDSAAPIKDASGKILGAVMVFHNVSERRQLERHLRENEQRFRTTFNQAAVGMAIADCEGKFERVNDRFCEISGYTPEELTQLTFKDLTFPDDLPDTDKQMHLLVSGDIPYFAIEKRYVRKDRSTIWVLSTVTKIKSEGGEQTRFIGVVEDVTKRIRAEEELREARTRLEATLQAGEIATWIWDIQENRLVADRNLARIFSVSDEEAAGAPLEVFIKAIHPEDLARVEESLAQAIASPEGIYEIDYRVVQPDQSIRWVNARGKVERDQNGRPLRMPGLLLDITRRKLIEEELRSNERQLQALANSIPQLAWIAEADGNIFWYNQRWFEYTGTTLEQMAGWGWQSVHDPLYLPKVIERWKYSLETGNPFEMEFPLRGADGVFRWYLTRVNPLRNAEGRITRWFGTNTDVNEVKRTQDALTEETRILELLNKTGKMIASELNLESLVQAVTDAGTELSGAKFGAFFYNVINAKGESLLLYTLSGAPREAFEKFGMPRNTPIFRPTFVGEGIVRSADITKDPRYGKMPPHHGMPKGHLPVRSYLAVSVISRSGEVIGGLFFGHPEPNVFTEKSERLISGLATQAAIAIDNARLYETAQREIAERKRTEQTLRESEQFNRSIIDSSKDCIKILDLAGNLVGMAESGQRMLCIPDISSYLNKSWFDFWNEPHRSAARLAVEKAASGDNGSFVGFFKMLNGEEKWWDVQITPMFDSSGKPEKLLAVLRDVTERQESEQMRFRLASVVESSDDAIISTTLDGIITTWNQGAERMYGYSATEAIGSSINMMIPQDRIDEEPAMMERLRKGERVDHYETVRVRKDGTLLDVTLSVSAVRDASGAIVGASKIARDITDRKRAEAELKRAKEELEFRVKERTASLQETTEQLETFCYTIAHDLRSPLRAQQNFAAALLSDHSESLDELGKEYAQRILGSAKRLDRLVNDLLLYSKVTRAELVFQKVDLSKLVVDLQMMLSEQIKSKNATINVGPLFPVTAHEATLQIALGNLVENSLKFVTPGSSPQIHIYAVRMEGTIRIWVEDKGIGINPEHSHKIFGVFERLHSPSAYPGTGIGLAIVQKGIVRMGGRVGFESMLGQGSRFWIELPAA